MTDVMDQKEREMPEKTGMDTLSRRYGDLVYAAALRQVGEAHAAADVMQGVFMVMVRKEKEGKLPEERFMAGWLLLVTNYVAKEMKRARRRRMLHERRAAEVRPEEMMASEEEKEAVLERLDEALLRMRAVDREVIARRYLRSESVGEVAAALGMTENTVSKRIARALEKLHGSLVRRGVTLGVTGITGVIGSQALVKTPAAVAGSSGVVTMKVVKGVMWRLVMAKAKIMAGVVVAGILLAGVTVVGVHTISVLLAQNDVVKSESPATGPALVQSTRPRMGSIPDDMEPAPKPTDLSKRYSRIFTQMDEKKQMDLAIEEAAKSIGHDDDERIIEMQVNDIALLWNHLEAAAKEVAQRHGESVAALNDAPPIPSNPVEAGIRRVQFIINKRMVIPLDDAMAKEVVELLNARYAQSKTPASQP